MSVYVFPVCNKAEKKPSERERERETQKQRWRGSENISGERKLN